METREERKPVKMIRSVPGEYVYVPVFTCEEIIELNPDEILKRVRQCHIKCGQLDILEAIDKDVAENGNPYIPKTFFPMLDEDDR